MNRLTFSLLAFILMYLLACVLAGCKSQPPAPEAPKQDQKVEQNVALPGFRLEWSKMMFIEVDRNFEALDKASKDMATRFCPKYALMDRTSRVIAWSHLAAAMIKFESGRDKKTGYIKTCSTMTESTGQDSIGFFQLSYGDRNCPSSKKAGDLCEPSVNIKCGVATMAHWVGQHGVVAAGGYESTGAPAPKGLARYWSVIRVPDPKPRVVKGKRVQRPHHLKEIIDIVRASPGCA